MLPLYVSDYVYQKYVWEDLSFQKRLDLISNHLIHQCDSLEIAVSPLHNHSISYHLYNINRPITFEYDLDLFTIGHSE